MRLSNSSFTWLQRGHQRRNARQTSLSRADFPPYRVRVCRCLWEKSNLNDLSDVRPGQNTRDASTSWWKKQEKGRSGWSAEFRRSVTRPLGGGSSLGRGAKRRWWRRVSSELMSLVVNGVRADFITSSRLLSLNKHLPVTSFTGPGTERSRQAGRRRLSGRQRSRLTMKYLSVKVQL